LLFPSSKDIILANMADKNLEDLIVKITKKVLKKEIKNGNQENLPIVLNESNSTLDNWESANSSAEAIEDIQIIPYSRLPDQEDIELERKLRELKFKQELRKDWISFLVKDVIVYSTTMIFILVLIGFYLFRIN
jgi:hypothetical protein